MNTQRKKKNIQASSEKVNRNSNSIHKFVTYFTAKKIALARFHQSEDASFLLSAFDSIDFWCFYQPTQKSFFVHIRCGQFLTRLSFSPLKILFFLGHNFYIFISVRFDFSFHSHFLLFSLPFPTGFPAKIKIKLERFSMFPRSVTFGEIAIYFIRNTANTSIAIVLNDEGCDIFLVRMR